MGTFTYSDGGGGKLSLCGINIGGIDSGGVGGGDGKLSLGGIGGGGK